MHTIFSQQILGVWGIIFGRGGSWENQIEFFPAKKGSFAGFYQKKRGFKTWCVKTGFFNKEVYQANYLEMELKKTTGFLCEITNIYVSRG